LIPFTAYKVEDTLCDEERTLSKSRAHSLESKRILCAGETPNKSGYCEAGLSESANNRDSESYDLEVYDDRMFYAMLLKVSLLFVSLFLELSNFLVPP
jgi:hypothetical protein